MSRKFLKQLMAATLALACTALFAGAARADDALEQAIEDSVVAGLGWLAAQQNADGSWGGGCDRVAKTGLAVLKFEDRALDLGFDPLDEEYEYSAQVTSGLGFITDPACQHSRIIGVEPAGNPDADGDGIGVYFTDCGGHEIYNTGVAMMALAGSGHPELYGATLQDTCDFMCWAQADPGCGLHQGGWRYGADDCNSDNSNAGYATLGLGFAAAPPPYGFGMPVPQFVQNELSLWIDVIQDDIDGDVHDGGSWYDPYSHWVNILKTGNLLYEMGLVGDTVTTTRVQDAVDYIERHWYDGGSCDTGWRDHRQAMFTMMKGLESLGIDLLDLDGDGEPEHDWFAEVAQHLIDTQNVGGSWPHDCWGDQVLSTAWALLTLEKAVPAFEIPVPVDVKPTSCPNPLNRGSKGVLPVAILGTEDFEVTQVNPATVTLAGVAALRWELEDVATPYEPYLGKEGAYDCNEYGADGYVDMTFKFDTRAIAAALGDVSRGDVLVLPLTGNLLDEHGGTPIAGEDVIIIRK